MSQPNSTGPNLVLFRCATEQPTAAIKRLTSLFLPSFKTNLKSSTVEIDRNKDNSLKNLRLVLKEGRNREVRRLMAAVGCSIAHLKRTRFGPIELGWLKVGHYEMLTPDEVEPLTNCSSLV